MGIELAEIPYEVIASSEIDKYAIVSCAAIHSLEFRNWNTDYSSSIDEKKIIKKPIKIDEQILNKANECISKLGSITDIVGSDMPRQIDLLTYSFPCTDLSKPGKQKGLNNTRSGLVYEVLRILSELKDLDNLPKVLIMQNVVDLVHKKFIKQFNEIQLELESIGYTNYTQVLNSKYYGIAQNRDRVFMVSILGDYNYNFPKPFELEHRLKDYLESNVGEKYYLAEKQIKGMIAPKFESMSIDRVNEVDGIYNTLTTMTGGNREPKVFDRIWS